MHGLGPVAGGERVMLPTVNLPSHNRMQKRKGLFHRRPMSLVEQVDQVEKLDASNRPYGHANRIPVVHHLIFESGGRSNPR
jgi:hypothetical protein